MVEFNWNLSKALSGDNFHCQGAPMSTIGHRTAELSVSIIKYQGTYVLVHLL